MHSLTWTIWQKFDTIALTTEIQIKERDFMKSSLYFKDVSSAINFDPIPINHACDALQRVRARGARVFIAGNGGSAATAMHFENDLIKHIGIDALAIPHMISTVTAYGNDVGVASMFSEVLEKIGSRRDLLFAITCSGNSGNILWTIEVAEKKHMDIVLLTGRKENNRAFEMMGDNVGRISICVGDHDIKVQEDCHMIVCHSIIEALTSDAVQSV
jgi:D-sedoheptulose 7-phosphate isomerase